MTETGFRIKRILDIGRCLFLRNLGYDTKLLNYCDITVSPENLVILVK
jgi:hypothetical protein